MAFTAPTTPLHTVSDPSLLPLGRSLSVSFTPVSPTTPSTPQDPSAAIPIRWTKELEQRLRFAQKSLEEHQRKWSVGQEDYLDEVEALQELKRRFEKFIRRRSKQHSKEGKKFLRAAGLGSSDVESAAGEGDLLEDDKGQASRKRSGSLLRRLSAGMVQRTQSEHGTLTTTLSQTSSDVGRRGLGALLAKGWTERASHRSMPI